MTNNQNERIEFYHNKIEALEEVIFSSDNKNEKDLKNKNKLIYTALTNSIQNFTEVNAKLKTSLEENLIKSLDEIFKNNMIIQKNDLASAIRLFMTLVLFREREEDKDKKIKSNKKNIIDYLKYKDLWKSSIYTNTSKFEDNLLKIKILNIKIKEILFFYYYLVNNEDERFEAEVENNIKKKEEDIKKQKEIEKQLAKEIKDNKKTESSEDDSDKSSSSDESSDDDSETKKRKKKKKKKNKKRGSDDDEEDENDNDEDEEE
jgi:hypothetical protein